MEVIEGAKIMAPLSAPATAASAAAGTQAPSPPSLSGRLAGLVRSISQGNQSKIDEKNKILCEKLQDIRVKFVRLVHRLGQSADNGIAAQVLYRFALAEQLKGGKMRNVNNEKTYAIALEEEANGQEELDFCCTVLVLGKSGVGKSATINSVFDKPMTETSAFGPSTKKVEVINGMLKGIRMKVIDTPGLSPCMADRRHNEKVVSSIKHCIRKNPPDIVLYVDRLDSQSKDSALMRFIGDRFGPAIWFNAIIVLTHGASAPPDGPDGMAMRYDSYVSHRSKLYQQTVRAAVGDNRLLNPVSLIENHPACRTNRSGEKVLPNGMVWRPELLLLCFAARILAEANLFLKLPESMPLKRLGERRSGSPMPVLLASLLQSRAEVQMPDEEEYGEDPEVSDESDGETDYDELPPFRRLMKEELEHLDDANRASYYEELSLREKLYKRKLWKMQCKRWREQKQIGDEQEENVRDMAPAVAPDVTLPTSFHSDDPTHRYRYIDDASWMVRPVTDPHGWDHDSGFNAANLETSFHFKKKHPVSVAGQIVKDKKNVHITFDGSAAWKHSEDRVTTGGLDIQTVGRDVCYNVWSGTSFRNHKYNRTIAGMGITMVGDKAVLGVRLEDKVVIAKRAKILMSGATSLTRGDAAYGGIIEATVIGPDYPVDRTNCTVGLSVMNWTAKDVAYGANLQSQIHLGGTAMVLRGNVNNRGTGQITFKINSTDNIQIALLGILTVLRSLFKSRLFRLELW